MNRAFFAISLTAVALRASAALAGDAQSQWEGAHAGLSGGYVWGNFQDEVYDGYYGNKVDGGTIGLQLGYDWAFYDKLILGVEGDFSLDDVSGDNSNWEVTYYKNKDASLRARLGWDLGSYMPYVTAGGAWASITEKYVDGFTSLQVENSRSQQGWTAGAGVDARVSDDISMRVEYRHSDYGSTPEDSWYKLHVTDETLRLGINYNFR